MARVLLALFCSVFLLFFISAVIVSLLFRADTFSFLIKQNTFLLGDGIFI